MKTPREILLDPSRKVPADEVSWYFMASYYDGPVFGLAIYRKRILRFCCFEEDIPDHSVYVLQELNEAELKEEIRAKEKFQSMVGTYGCFDEDGKLLPKFVGDEASRQRYFEEKHRDERADPSPYERPIFAWFDVTEKKEPNQAPEPTSGLRPAAAHL